MGSQQQGMPSRPQVDPSQLGGYRAQLVTGLAPEDYMGLPPDILQALMASGTSMPFAFQQGAPMQAVPMAGPMEQGAPSTNQIVAQGQTSGAPAPSPSMIAALQGPTAPVSPMAMLQALMSRLQVERPAVEQQQPQQQSRQFQVQQPGQTPSA